MSGLRPRTASPAHLARALCRALARTASTEAEPHHAAFLDDIAEHEPPRDAWGEARACLHHVVGAVTQPQPTPFPLVWGVGLMWLAMAFSLLAPAPAIPYDETLASGLALVGHLVGMGGIALAGTSSGAIGRRWFLWWGLLPTAAAQAMNLVTTFPHVNAVISLGDNVLRVGETIGLAASAAMLAGLLSRNERWFFVGWRGLAWSMLVVAGAHISYGIGFARAGDAVWVCVLCVLLVGHTMFLRGITRFRPALWSDDPPPRGRP
jgi:hypothetical protein